MLLQASFAMVNRFYFSTFYGCCNASIDNLRSDESKFLSSYILLRWFQFLSIERKQSKLEEFCFFLSLVSMILFNDFNFYNLTTIKIHRLRINFVLTLFGSNKLWIGSDRSLLQMAQCSVPLPVEQFKHILKFLCDCKLNVFFFDET